MSCKICAWKRFLLFVNILRVWIVLINIYSGADETHGYGKGCGISRTRSKRFNNHNALGQLTNQSTYFGRRGFMKQGLNRVFETD